MSKIHELAENNDAEAIYIARAIGPEINERNEKGDTPIQVAVICGNYDAVRALRALGAVFDIETAEYSIFEPAILNDDLEMVNLLAELGANVNSSLGVRKPIFWGVQDGRTDIVLRMLELGVDPNISDTNQSGGNNLLREAAGEGNLEIVNALIDAGAELSIIDEEGLTSDQLAEAWGHFAVASVIRNARKKRAG